MSIKNNDRDFFKMGFSIIELSMVLVIIALVAGTALAVGASRVESARIRSTNERINFIMEALDLYVKLHGSLPCPSDNNLVLTDIDFGNGAGSGDSAGYPAPGNCINENLNYFAGSNRTLLGGVPTQHLKISPAVTLDGWGRRFSYTVDEKLTFSPANTGPPAAGWADSAVEGTITVTNGTSNITTQAAMLLISHGSNGHGAWKGKGGNGQLDRCAVAGAPEKENGSVAGCLPAFDNIFVQKFLAGDYDDIVVYREKWQFETP